MSREVLANEAKQCQHCDKGVFVVWRCRDCGMGTPMCRAYMRVSHRENPFHRIEQWNGTFFWPAELWEVGVYLLVRHHAGSGTGNGTYLRVVHTNGIHNIAMVNCQCQGVDLLPCDLLAAHLLPASFQWIRTLFTTQLLDLFRLCNLELKASAYQFYHLLHRLTLLMAPAEVVDLYRELKWAGHGPEVKDGELVNFCPACPQPGVNLPDDWKDDSARKRWAYKRIFVADGNFKADHVRQQNAAGDVWLSEGGGMMPKNEEYMSFLQSAIERLTKAPCENTFRAIMNSLQASKACNVTGVVGISCGRHGCYAPNTLIDLFKGEQQKNVDFAFLKAITSTRVEPEQGVLLIYNIACQYFVHLQDRIGCQLPFGLEVEAAIGLFHVHAHKDECFFRYATSFIPGAGVVAGEILESLWSTLNSISPTARTATLVHRAEMLDDHAADSNHKKMLGMVSTLCKSHRRAVDMLEHAQSYYKSLTIQGIPIAVDRWKQDIESAEWSRPFDITAMDIYAAKLESTPVYRHAASDTPGSALHHWMALSLTVEEKHFRVRIQAKVQQLGRPGSSNRDAIEREREGLTGLMLQLKQAQQLAEVSETIGPPLVQPDIPQTWDKIANEPVPISPETIIQSAPAPALPSPSMDRNTSASIGPLPIEEQLLCLPSNGNVSAVHRELELSHRISLANHYLNGLQNLIVEKSFQFSHVIRVSQRKGVTTRSRASVKKLNLDIAVHCRMYAHCRAWLIALGANAATQSRLRVLTIGDVQASTAVINPNEPGSTKLKLSWIWQTAGVRCVHWLRARAQLNRWQEEVSLTAYEMQWTRWAGVMGPNGTAGLVAYAKRKQAMWEHLRVRADMTFTLLIDAYKSPL
ncbi:hypothetical protein BYT27DRAFT_7227064 [Phlegmacium glaucopus]|nr:hypothetical protein BYT27DRAFT_7227064 [Phlegmacium glaucopus]